MDVSVTVSIISGVGVIVGAWIGLLGTKKGTLAAAEKDFRTAVLEDNEKLRTRIDDLEKKLASLTVENSRLNIELLKIKKDKDSAEPAELVVDGGSAS